MFTVTFYNQSPKTGIVSEVQEEIDDIFLARARAIVSDGILTDQEGNILNPLSEEEGEE